MSSTESRERGGGGGSGVTGCRYLPDIDCIQSVIDPRQSVMLQDNSDDEVDDNDRDNKQAGLLSVSKSRACVTFETDGSSDII